MSVLSCRIPKIHDTGLDIRSDKCGIFYERRSGNRWYKAKSDRLSIIKFNYENVKVLKRDEPYVYLGKPMTVAEETQDEVNQMLDDYREPLVKIELSAPIAINLETLEVITLAKIKHDFPNCNITEAQLQEFDKLLICSIRKIFNLNHSTTTRSFFSPK